MRDRDSGQRTGIALGALLVRPAGDGETPFSFFIGRDEGVELGVELGDPL
jgi:hypothetical protein